MKNKKNLKIILTILIGLVVLIKYLMVFEGLLYSHSPLKNILIPRFAIAFISTIIFLILWNLRNNKKIYLILLIPLICFVSAKALIKHDKYIQNIVFSIPTVNEYGIDLWDFIPFKHDNLLMKLYEKSTFQINNNLPNLDGATAFYPVYAAFVQAVYPKGQYFYWEGPVLCSRTEEAYDNLLKGKADIIFCLEPSDLQTKKFYDNGIKLKLVPIGKEAFVFFVHKQSYINDLTIENIRGIYSGKIKNWKELENGNKKIIAFQRPKNSGSQTTLEKIMGNTPIIKPRKEYVPAGMGQMINVVASYRNFSNAIGYSFLQYSTEMVKNDQIKLLSIEGVYPSRETVQDNSYPFSVNFYDIC